MSRRGRRCKSRGWATPSYRFVSVTAIDKRKIDEGRAVELLLLVGNFVDESELAGEFIVRVDEHGESELVLVVHEESLLLGLRRDGDDRGVSRNNLRGNVVHRLHLADAERTPASANEAENQAAFAEKIGGRNALAIVIGKFERRDAGDHP